MQKYQITLLIRADEVAKLSRDISQHIDSARVEAYIRESQNIDIKCALGDALFLDVCKNPDSHASLLEGCEYERRDGQTDSHVGLKSALAYFVYARLVKNADNNVTRFGVVAKNDEHSANVEYKQRMTAYNDAYSIGETYLKDVVKYLKETKYKLYDKNGGLKSHRVKYRVIGK